MILSKYKNSFFSSGFKKKISDESYFILVLILLSFLMFFFSINFKFIFIFFLLAWIILYFRFRDLFFSIYFLFIFSFIFFAPNKFYPVEIIRGADLLLSSNREGYFLGYGLRIIDIVAFFSFSSFIFDKRSKEFFKNIFKQKEFFKYLLIIFSFFSFLIMGLLQIQNLVANKVLSIVWLFQYSYFYLIIILSLFAFHIYGKKFFSYLFLLITAIISFEFILVIFQFLNQGYLGKGIEMGSGGSFYTGADENNSLFRPAGTFLYHNQLSLFVASLMPLFFYFYMTQKKKLSLIIFTICFLMILMVQTRIIWIFVFMFFLSIYLFYKKEVKKLFKKISKNNIFVYFAYIILPLALVIIIPRILLSFNFFYEGAGFPIRVKMVKEGFEAFRINPIFGFGVSTNEIVLHDMFPLGYTSVFPAAIHLAFLQFLLEFGIFGFVLFFWIIIYQAKELIYLFLFEKNVFKNRRLLIFSILMAITSFLMYYCFHPHVGIVEFPLLGLIVALSIIATSEKKNFYEKL